ncbi:TapY2 family type IVa secretion system protein [Shewanella gelidimarina]|uniref:TapY2 family type IVa secretion system protein n=1 Tax=Shewanella gelidimarina TaxID=56813 RepID=UPI00200C91DA|nr:TapY2 family type IVa secretion system protein [Shewanella gelidimarina]MCL1056984.1 TapY2 family type IVa secretion system protein [Shewanella gelidimarina]
MIKSIVVIVSLLFVQSSVASEMADYKCYVKTSEGEALALYKWKIKDSKRMAASLVGQRIDGERLKYAFIKSVEQCKQSHESFTIGRAQQLDKITAR